MSTCACINCSGRVLESLPWYAEYEGALAGAKEKLASGIVDQFDYEDELCAMSHDLVLIARAVISYSEGLCLYQVRPNVVSLYLEDESPKNEADKKLLASLNEVLVSSDPMAYIDYAFTEKLMLKED